MGDAMTSSHAPRRAPFTGTRPAAIGAVPARDLLALLDANDLEALIDAGFRVLQRVVRWQFHVGVLSNLTKRSAQGTRLARNQEIADRLAKSLDAVKFLLHRIYQKTGVSGRAALVARLRA